MAWLTSSTTETAIVDKLAEEDEHGGHHHGHTH
jgi:chaperonin GroEL